MMHIKIHSKPTPLCERLGKGPCLSRTPTWTLGLRPPRSKTNHLLVCKLDLSGTLYFGLTNENSLEFNSIMSDKDTIAFEDMDINKTNDNTRDPLSKVSTNSTMFKMVEVLGQMSTKTVTPLLKMRKIKHIMMSFLEQLTRLMELCVLQLYYLLKYK